MKRGPQRSWRPPHARFPGLYCPGLIEAATTPCETDYRPPGFRGSIAPASLKRDWLVAAVRAGAGFRGSIAPASLKRGVEGEDVAGARRFRGSIAPASLKPEDAYVHLGRHGHRFRGSIAPASLKPTSPCFGRRASGGFRGSIAPASLKQARRDGKVPEATVSGALLPRPH